MGLDIVMLGSPALTAMRAVPAAEPELRMVIPYCVKQPSRSQPFLCALCAADGHENLSVTFGSSVGLLQELARLYAREPLERPGFIQFC